MDEGTQAQRGSGMSLVPIVIDGMAGLQTQMVWLQSLCFPLSTVLCCFSCIGELTSM